MDLTRRDFLVISGLGFISFLILDEVEKVVVPWKAATVG